MGQLDHRDEVLVDGVDAPWADEAHEVEAAPAFRDPEAGVVQRRVVEERAVGDGRADPWQVLENAEPRAEVEVPDLAVAHLPGGQADGLAGCLQPAVRPLGEQPVPVPHRCR